MIGAAEVASSGTTSLVIVSAALFAIFFAAAVVAYKPLGQVIRWQEWVFANVLQDKLLLDVRPRVATMLTFMGIVLLTLIGYAASGSFLGAAFGAAAGIFLPVLTMRRLAIRRLTRLEGQLVVGVQTLASGVRAGLNLVQSMQLVARDGPAPLRQGLFHSRGRLPGPVGAHTTDRAP